MPTKILPQDLSTTVDFNISELSLSDGTAALPSLAFASDQNTGIYSAGSDILAFSTGGTEKMRIDSGGTIHLIEAVRGKDGSAAAPSFTFASDADTGIFRSANVLGFSVDSVEKFRVDTNRSRHTVAAHFIDGTVSIPSIAFDSDTDSGMWRNGSNVLAFSTGGVNRFQVYDTALQPLVPIRGNDGTAALPAYSFDLDTDTGAYRSATNQFAVSVGGEVGFLVDRTAVNLYASNSGTPLLRWQSAQEGLSASNNARIYNSDGTALLPSYAFTGDTDTGFYRPTASRIGLSIDGTERLRFFPSAIGNQDGTAIDPSYAFTNDMDTGMYRAGTNLLGFATNGIGQMFLNAGGGLRSVTYSQSFHDGGFGERVTQNQSTSVDYAMGGDFIGFVFVQTFNNVNTAHGSKLFWVASSATELSFTQLAAQRGQSGLITVTNPSGMTLRVALGATGTSNNGVMFMRINYAAG